MKVFKFDAVTGQKGEQIDGIQRPEFFQNASGVVVNTPKDWIVYDTMSDKRNAPMIFSEPVCFCMGRFTCGSDTTWQWAVYVPAESDESFANRHEFAFFA